MYWALSLVFDHAYLYALHAQGLLHKACSSHVYTYYRQVYETMYAFIYT